MALIKTNARSATALDATILTGNLPAINGSALTNLSAGKVAQVVNKVDDTYQATSSSTFADTSLSQAFTPTATSSKVLIMLEHQCMKSSGNTGIQLQLLRDSTTLGAFITIGGETEETTRNDFGSSCFFYLDSPNTTSAVTYKTQMKNYVNGVGGARVNASTVDQSSMVLMEILA
jgi:hypothetical protein